MATTPVKSRDSHFGLVQKMGFLRCFDIISRPLESPLFIGICEVLKDSINAI